MRRVLRILSAIPPALLVTSAAMALEEPVYRVIERNGPIEIRRVEPYLVAETFVDGSFRRAANTAFSRLFGYISGANSAAEGIKMTAPVSQQQGGEKIAMTAPVAQAGAGSGYVVSFMMPSAYTLETLPVPEDPRVEIRKVPAEYVAVLRYSGTWSTRRYRNREARLREWIDGRGLLISGPARWARYNSPFSLPLLRRNEVQIPVQPPPS